MKDIYNLQKAQQASKKEDVDQELIREAERIEAQNYQKTKNARLKFEKAAQKQKGTTASMFRQGEKIKKSKKAAVSVHRSAERARDTAEEIDKNSHLFNIRLPFVDKIKRWFRRDKNEEREIEAMAESDEYEEQEYGVSSDVEEPENEEYVKGQNKTDYELKKILHVAKKVNKEASVQKKIANKQTTELKDIAKANEYSGKTIDETDKNLKKGL